MLLFLIRITRTPAMWFLPMGLLILWGGIIFDIQRSQAYQYHFGQTSIQLQAQTFAESTRSNLDRINAFLSNIRSDYLEKQSRFGEQVSHRQEFVSDLVDELMVIDVNGNRVFSNIHSKSEPIYLGDKDFFKSHIGRGVDSLFISQANLNPLTHHWGLQFSRPIFNGNLFKGVIVASVSSDSLSNFNDKISLSNSVVTTISKSSGSILSRSVSNDEIYRLQLKGFPFNNPNGPVKGVYQRVSQSDQTNRLFAYVRLPEFDLIVFASQPVQEVMAPFEEHRIELLTTGTLLSLFLIGIGLLVMRNQKQSERVEQKARESEAMLLAAIEATGEGFVIFDQQDRLVFLNERYRDIYSTTASVLKIGNTFEEIIRYGVSQGQYASAIGQEEQWITQRLIAHSQSEDHVIQQLGDGTWLKIRERRTPQGYTVGFRIDITEQVEARQAAEQALVEAQQAEKAKALFLSNISHELRTPLNGIVGMTEVLNHTELSPQQKEILGYLKESTEKLRILLINLLDFSELQSQTLGIQLSPFNPYEMLGAVTSKFQSLANSKRLSLKAESQGYVPYNIIGDMARISQVLRQLIENALKFTSVGEVEVTMFFSAATDDEKPKLGFSVRDTGQGISADDHATVFQPFTQKDGSSTREQGGTGIGLSLARGIVEKMGGQLVLKSVPGVGSTFTFHVTVSLPS